MGMEPHIGLAAKYLINSEPLNEQWILCFH